MGAPVARLGRYTLVRSLGAGGMAELFLARADGIGGFAKLVALKRVLPHKSSNERFVRMLLNEARLVATLDHPNIAQVYDIGVDNNEYYFAMEYVHGADLRRVLHEAPNRRVQLENALHIGIGICAGLHHAHEARDPDGNAAEIVHRDVSPSNVLVSYQGAVKLVDFGVAKAASMVSETHEGVIKGKYGYMSPEQCLGHQVDRRSDLFAVGILLWEMTTGRRLYKIKGDLVTLQRVVYVDAPPPSRYVANYPPELERIVMRALARDPQMRHATAEELQLELEAFALHNRLPISAVSMAMEMRQLFKDRFDAWQQAQAAGRSLVDHLAEASSEDPLSSDSGGDDDLDAVLGQLDTNVFAANVLPPAAAPSPRVTAPPSRTGVVLLGVIALAASAVAVWSICFRTSTPQRGSVAVVATAIDAEPPPPSVDAAVEPAVAVDAVVDEVEPPAKPAHAKEPKHAKRPKEPPPKEPPPEPPPKQPPPDPVKAAAPPDAAVGPAPGTVDTAGVRAVVRSHVTEIEACVGRAKMENRDLTGKLTLRIELSPTGKVTGTSVASSTGGTPALETCVKKAVAGWTFPSPAGNTRAVITYPFAF